MTNDRSARMTLVVNLPLKTNLTLDGRWTALVVVASEMGLMALFRTCNPVCCIFRRRMQISLVTLLLLGFVASKKYKDVNVSSCPRSKQVEWLFQPQCNVCITLKVRKVVDCFLQWRQNGKNVIYSQDLGYLILGLRILSPEHFAGLLVLLGFEDP